MILGICVCCREVVQVDVKETVRTETCRGHSISYKEKETTCKKCGELVWVDYIEEENIKAYDDAVNKVLYGGKAT